MKTPLRVLVVEDSEFDARMLITMLRKGDYEPTFERVETAETMSAALDTKPWDLVLADYNLPTFNAPAALQLLQGKNLDLPFIIISGGIGEDIAVAAMKAGAHDYLMKGSLARLVPAVERELREAAHRAARRAAEEATRESELRFRLVWETASDAVIVMDTESQINFANPAVEQIFGYRIDEVVGQNLTMLQPESLRGGHLAGIKRYLATGQKKLNWRATETLGRHKDGREFPIELSFSDMELHGHRRFVGFIRDITERKRVQEELKENEEQFRVAREIQQRLFPKAAPKLPGFDIAGASYPAEATGGDYFDYIAMLHDGLGVVVADVTGHGMGPALLMAETRAYLRIVAINREDVGEVLTRANLILAEDVGYERYVTLLLARLDAAERKLTYASAGHPPGYVLTPNDEVRLQLKRTGIPLSIKADTQYHSAPPVTLAPGELVLFLTDGIEEAMSPAGELFGIERTLAVVRAYRDQPARQIVEAIYLAVRDFSQDTPQLDDLTAIVIKVQ